MLFITIIIFTIIISTTIKLILDFHDKKKIIDINDFFVTFFSK